MNKMAPFAKMNGLGNQIIVADMRGRADRITPAAAVYLAQDPVTRFDQIMAIHDARTANTDHYIEIINCDGTQAQACGNGTRCVVQALHAENQQTKFTFETLAGVLTAHMQDDTQISVDMGCPRFGWQDLPLSHELGYTAQAEIFKDLREKYGLQMPALASIGNPHIIFWVDHDVWSYPLEEFGTIIENDPLFPQRVNVSIAKVTSEHDIILRTWERGAGLTRACGSAACAAAVSAVRTNKTKRHVTMHLPGGDLTVEWRDDNHIIMTGPAEWEFSGLFDPQTGHWSKDEQSSAASSPSGRFGQLTNKGTA
ncbi:diaminopimelate epimerase [Paenochrobactrum pullorum]|uniref:diaminopimelate epimerase n=1 Tax=Paenochrobactrum pullorum TaxID=1324351 RepID=UPI0035BC0BFE